MSCPATSSGSITGNVAVAAHPARVLSIMLETDGTNPATFILYDNPSAASGLILASISCAGTDRFATWSIEEGVIANNGIFAAITGAGAKAVVHYGLGD